jgi:hypothetical protein
LQRPPCDLVGGTHVCRKAAACALLAACFQDSKEL